MFGIRDRKLGVGGGFDVCPICLAATGVGRNTAGWGAMWSHWAGATYARATLGLLLCTNHAVGHRTADGYRVFYPDAQLHEQRLDS